MRYKGKELKGKNKEIIPILRPGGDIIFIAEAIQDWSKFNELVPVPEPPVRIKPGGITVKNTKDKNYLKAIDDYNELKSSYIVVASLEATPELEWDKVDINKPTTWNSFKKELEDAGLTDVELSQIVMGVRRANSLDESMIEEARANFLRGNQGSES